MRIALSLSVKTVAPPVLVRDQPSGTFTLNPPLGGVNGTKTWLSGMSPAGLTSGAFGSGQRSCALDDDQAPQPAAPMPTTAIAARARGAHGPSCNGRIRFMRRPYARPVNAPPASGQRPVKPAPRPPRSRLPSSHGRTAILLVEDDDAIAVGLTRVLEAQGYTVRRLARGTPAPPRPLTPT